jgi:leader peptidase (prepilin peptidase)/N-methyltransferase
MSLFDLPYWLMSAFVFVLGAITGSFLNVCIHRIPAEPLLWPALKGLWQPPSRCPRCKTQIGWRDNIPILSWLLLRGRCRTCRMWISARYPLVELLNATLFLALYWLEVPAGWPPQAANSSLFSDVGPQTVPGWWPLSATTGLHLRFFYHLVLIESLIVASFIDIDRREIPDASTLPAMVIGLLGGLLIGRVHIVPAWSQNPFQVFTLTRMLWPDWRVDQWPAVPLWFSQYPHLHGLLVSVAGLLIAGGLTWIVRLIGYAALRREAMGFGDVILMAVIGSFLGWQPAVLAFIIAPAVALVLLPVQLLVHRDRYIPYGPYLSVGALIVLAAWKPLWNGFGGWGGAAAIFDLGPILILLFAVMAVMFFLTLLLVQGLKRLFGLRDHPEEFVVQWTAADQSQFQAGERVDLRTGLWRLPEWPGQASGRGVLQEERWRRSQYSVLQRHSIMLPPGPNGR